jgi:GAF domain-containing protein
VTAVLHAPPSDAYLATMVSVADSVAAADDLETTLDHIARSAAEVADGDAAGIFLIGPGNTLELRGSCALPLAYRRFLDRHPLMAVDRSEPVARSIADGRVVEAYDLAEAVDQVGWGSVGIAHRSLVSLPLSVDGEAVGAMVVYRAEPGPWSGADIETVTALAEHAATAIRIANLIERKDRQLEGLALVVRGLREQAHEHANRIHSVMGMLALGEQREARRFVDTLLADYHDSQASVAAGIQHRTLASLLLAEVKIAMQRGIRLKIDRRSRLTSLPARVGDAEAVVIVGHLLEHALNAIEEQTGDRRRVTFYAKSASDRMVLSTRDWGSGSPCLSRSVLIDAVAAVGGSVEFIPLPRGTLTRITAL